MAEGSNSITIPDNVETAEELTAFFAQRMPNTYQSFKDSGYAGAAAFAGLNISFGHKNDDGKFEADFSTLIVDLASIDSVNTPDGRNVNKAASPDGHTQFLAFNSNMAGIPSFIATVDQTKDISIGRALTPPIPLMSAPDKETLKANNRAVEAYNRLNGKKDLSHMTSCIEKTLFFHNLRLNTGLKVRDSGEDVTGKYTYNFGVLNITKPIYDSSKDENDTKKDEKGKSKGRKYNTEYKKEISQVKEIMKDGILRRELATLESMIKKATLVKDGVGIVASTNIASAVVKKALKKIGAKALNELSEEAQAAIKESIKSEVSNRVDAMLKDKTIIVQPAFGLAGRENIVDPHFRHDDELKELTGEQPNLELREYWELGKLIGSLAYDYEKESWESTMSAGTQYFDKITEDPTSQNKRDEYAIGKMCNDEIRGGTEIEYGSEEWNAVQAQTQKCLEDATRLHKDNPNLAIESTVNAVVNGKKEPENDSVTDEKMAADIAVLNENAMPYTAVGDAHDNAGVENTIDDEQVNDR